MPKDLKRMHQELCGTQKVPQHGSGYRINMDLELSMLLEEFYRINHPYEMTERKITLKKMQIPK